MSTSISADIIITSYNYAAFLGAAIESALGQTHKPAQVIVVDDGSNDDSVAVARAYPVKLVVQRNQGLGAARNAGAALSTSECLMFLDADDILEPTYIERCMEALLSAPQRVAYAYTQMRLHGADTGVFESRAFARRALLQGNFVNAAALIRRSAFEHAGGFDPSWRRPHEDYDLWLRMLSMGYDGIFVPEPLLRYRRHVSSMNTLSMEERSSIRRELKRRHAWLFLRYFAVSPVKLLAWALEARKSGTAKR